MDLTEEARQGDEPGGIALGMMVAAIVACFLAAWRALRTDPVRALRQ